MRQPITRAMHTVRLKPSQLRILSRSAQLLAQLCASSPAQPDPLTDDPEVTPGDIVQIRPFADPVFGGLLLRVMKADPYAIRGYLLRPHRGGCREAWHTFNHHEVHRIGAVKFPEAEWGFRS